MDGLTNTLKTLNTNDSKKKDITSTPEDVDGLTNTLKTLNINGAKKRDVANTLINAGRYEDLEDTEDALDDTIDDEILEPNQGEIVDDLEEIEKDMVADSQVDGGDDDDNDTFSVEVMLESGRGHKIPYMTRDTLVRTLVDRANVWAGGPSNFVYAGKALKGEHLDKTLGEINIAKNTRIYQSPNVIGGSNGSLIV